MTLELSVNHYICGDALSFPDFAEAVRQSGVTSVGVTRAAMAEMGLAGLKTCLGDNGLSVSSLNSAGYFTLGDPNPLQYSNAEMVDAAAFLEADVLCVITGGLGQPPLSVPDAHKRVREGIATLADYAASTGVTLGLEPIYPGDILTKGCINSCAHGLEIVAPYPNAKLILDLYHSWWDPGLPDVLHNHDDQIALIQLTNVKLDSGLVVGRDTLWDGALDLSGTLRLIDASGYTGNLEFELFSHDLAGRDPGEIIRVFPEQLEQCRQG